MQGTSIPYVFSPIAGITSANINNSKYLCIVDNGNVDEEEDSVIVLDALCILNPKIKEDVPIKKETTARIFPVKAGMKTSGSP